jgi:tetratricopeptide repeat protein 21B
MEDKNMEVRLHSLMREQLYHSAAEAINWTNTSVDNTFNKFYQALALLFTNKAEGALNLLTSLHADPLFNLSAIIASLHIYKHFKSIDAGDATHLEATLRSERKKANDKSLYYAALFLHLNNRQEKAREYAERALSINSGSNNIDGIILKGWIELMSNKEKSKKKNPMEYFETATKIDSYAIEAHQGKIKYLIQSDNVSQAFPIINQMISNFPNNQEFLVEKLRAHLAAKDWDAVGDLTKKINNISNPFIVKILEIQILATICHDGSFVDATPLLKKLFAALEKYEPTNGELFVNSARLFSRVCGRHIPILNECQIFVEKAIKLDEKNVNYLFELAQQQVLQGRFKDALSTFKKISQRGETSIEVTLLKIHCLFNDEQYEVAQQQLNIVEELHDNASSHTTFLLAKAMLLRQRNQTESLHLLKLAYQLQIKNASWISYGVEYLNNLNPDFLLSVAEEYFQYHGPEDSPQTLLELSNILTCVVQACPGLLPALYRLANANFIAGDYRAASATLHHIIDHVDPTYIEAYLLMAQIGIFQNNLSQAAQYLEMGLSYNFHVRDHPR